MAGYALHLRTPYDKTGTTGGVHMRDITDDALGWTRNIVMQGGYWRGTFTLSGQTPYLLEWFHNYANCDVIEKTGGAMTWQGFVATMDIDGWGTQLEVTVLGYVHTAAWQYATYPGGTSTASAWIQTLVETDCPLLRVGRIETNALVYSTDASVEQKPWDEMVNVVELGDASGNPWRVWVDNDRRLNYGPIDTTPLYYARGGISRRRNLLTMYNHVSGKFTDSTTEHKLQDITTAENVPAIARHWRRDEKIAKENLDVTSAYKLRDATLKEDGWPYAQAVASESNAIISDVLGADVSTNPWTALPGVCRDLAYSAGGPDYEGFLEDVRDFVVDEVEASVADDDKRAESLKFKTAEIDESDLVAARLEMNGTPRKVKKKRQDDNEQQKHRWNADSNPTRVHDTGEDEGRRR